MFDTCPALDDTFCPDCVSGSPGCEIEDEEGKVFNMLNIQGWAKEWSLGCANLASWLPLAAGAEFT